MAEGTIVSKQEDKAHERRLRKGMGRRLQNLGSGRRPEVFWETPFAGMDF